MAAALFQDKNSSSPPAYEPGDVSSDAGDADKALAELGYAPVSRPPGSLNHFQPWLAAAV